MSECKKNVSQPWAIVQEFNKLDEEIQNLIKEAIEAREFSYCPYSKLKVGSAVLCNDGTKFTGCNIESSAYNVGFCAERCAYSNAISQGKQEFKAIVIIADQEVKSTIPCGTCRQFMIEFGEVDVYVSRPGQGDVLCLNLDPLLPY